MNLFKKYSPLFYSYNTRFKWLKWIFHFLTENVLFMSVPFFYWIIVEKNLLNIYIILLYIFLLIIYYIQYEIWYIINDYFSIKKEKKPSFRIDKNVWDKFIYFQIFLRVFIVLISIIFIWRFNFQLSLIFLFLIVFTQITFYLHNFIRNYKFNFLSISLLHFSKFLIPFCILFFYLDNINQVFIYSTFIFIITKLYNLILKYNQEFWWINKLPLSVIYFYLLVFFSIIYIFSKELIILIYLIMFLIWFLFKMEKDFFNFKNNR